MATVNIESPSGVQWRVYRELHPPYPIEAFWTALGLIPYILDAQDTGTALEQITRKARSWDAEPYRGFRLIDHLMLLYTDGDIDEQYTPEAPLASCSFKGDRILVYEDQFVCIQSPDGGITVAPVHEHRA